MTTSKELQYFVDQVQDEGAAPRSPIETSNLASLLINHGGDDAPDELHFEVTNFLAAWDILNYAWKALLSNTDLDDN